MSFEEDFYLKSDSIKAFLWPLKIAAVVYVIKPQSIISDTYFWIKLYYCWSKNNLVVKKTRNNNFPFVFFRMFLLKNLFRSIWVVANNLYVIPAYFVWLIVLRPVLWVNPKLYWLIEDRFFGWLLSMVACWNYTAGEILKSNASYRNCWYQKVENRWFTAYLLLIICFRVVH